MSPLAALLAHLATAPAVLVWVDAVQGSVPRELGTWMAVFADRVVGTIGGGHLEHQAMAQARPGEPVRLAFINAQGRLIELAETLS